jgi:hypothetical protein
MSMIRRLLFIPVGLAPVLGVVFLAHCIDGTTPNCAGDAGCGPGVEAGDASFDSGDAGTSTDARPDTGADAGVDAGIDGGHDAGQDVAQEASIDAPGDAPLDAPVDAAG